MESVNTWAQDMHYNEVLELPPLLHSKANVWQCHGIEQPHIVPF